MTRSVKPTVLGMAAVAVAAFAVTAFAQEGGAQGVPAGTTRPPASAPTGEQLFAAKCAVCHDAGGWGTRALSRRVPADQALLTQRAGLPAAYAVMVVRQGVGSMPPFTPTDLSDADLDRLAEWLETKK